MCSIVINLCGILSKFLNTLTLAFGNILELRLGGLSVKRNRKKNSKRRNNNKK